ncbi:MAG: flagellar basal body rod protein FlgC [Bordetella sp.]|jgi:flagellar basal-body rod protein FlgC
MIDNIFGIAGTAMNAQLTRMNLTASNLANQNTTAPTEAEAFKAKRSVFKALLSEADTHAGAQFVGGVRVDKIVDLQDPNPRVYEPGSPHADADGYVWMSNVNEVTEMVEMMASSRAYQNNVEVVNTAKVLMMKTLDITKA